jgi:hypothetical protein
MASWKGSDQTELPNYQDMFLALNNGMTQFFRNLDQMVAGDVHPALTLSDLLFD